MERFKGKRGICKICRKYKHLSRNGNCLQCVGNKIISANYQMKTKQGPIYDKWRKSMIKFLNIEQA